jgi:pimeloyl-ACP methyl ester carboxylesterase
MRWVFLPGLDGTGLLLEPVLAQLPPEIPSTLVRYPCDLKGEYQDYVRLAGASFSHDEPVVLIAESFSGPVAVMLAATHANIKAIVLSASFVSHPRPKFLRHLLPLLKFCLRLNRSSSFAIRLLLAGMDAPKALVGIVALAGRRVPAEVFAHRLRLVLSCDKSEMFGTLTMPALSLVAAHDRLVPGAYSEKLKTFRPGLEVRTIASPHLVLERRTQEAIASISEFLARIPHK